MAGSLNKVMLIGNVGQDPEIRAVQNGAQVANISLATNRNYKGSDGERKTDTQWHRLTVWQNGDKGLVTNLIQPYVHKGSLIYVSGELRTRKWKDPEGNDRYTTEVVLSGPNSEIQLMDPKPSNGAAEQQRTSADIRSDAVVAEELGTSGLEEEIPF